MTIKEIASMIDISAVRAESTWNEIEDILQATRKYPFICIFSMPSMLDRILPYRKEIPNLRIGGIVGFPSGGETLETKLFEVKQLKEKGCDEIDMVLNIGKLKSGFVEEVKDEIEHIKAVVSPLPLKVIMEVVLLTDEEIATAARIIRDAGASFVKTGTGWAGATTEHHIILCKKPKNVDGYERTESNCIRFGNGRYQSLPVFCYREYFVFCIHPLFHLFSTKRLAGTSTGRLVGGGGMFHSSIAETILNSTGRNCFFSNLRPQFRGSSNRERRTITPENNSYLVRSAGYTGSRRFLYPD